MFSSDTLACVVFFANCQEFCCIADMWRR